MTEPVVKDNEELGRLEVDTDGHRAELTYRTRAGRLVLIHTGVPEALSGRGIGGQLVEAAIAKAAAGGMTLVPLCPFARSWLERHPDEAAKVPIDWAGS
jgi:uncharacterized protein